MIHVIREALDHHVRGTFQGPRWNFPSVLETLEGVTATQAAWKPAPHRNSIWQIVDHLAATNEWTLQALKMIDPGPSPAWREISGDDQAWEAEKRRLVATHERLWAAIAALTDHQLTATAPGLGRTWFDLTLGIAGTHVAYHVGQLEYLKLLARDMGIR